MSFQCEPPNAFIPSCFFPSSIIEHKIKEMIKNTINFYHKRPFAASTKALVFRDWDLAKALKTN